MATMEECFTADHHAERDGYYEDATVIVWPILSHGVLHSHLFDSRIHLLKNASRTIVEDTPN